MRRMSLYAEYIKENLGKETVESEIGFLTFYEVKDGMYIEDIYVIPEMRKGGAAAKMADKVAEIAKARGLKKLIGSVRPSAKNSTDSLKVLLSYGFKLESSINDGIIFGKEL